jgi:hypothetical protein
MTLSELPLLTNATHLAVKVASEINRWSSLGQDLAPAPVDPAAPSRADIKAALTKRIELPADLCLPAELLARFAPPLDAMGFTVDTKPRSFAKARISHSVAKGRAGREINLLFLPTGLLQEPDEQSIFEFTKIEYFFPIETSLYLFAEGVDIPHRSIRPVIKDVWRSRQGRKLAAKVVPWCDVADLEHTRSLQEAQELVKEMLEIQNGAPPAQPAPLTPREEAELGIADRVQLIKQLAALSQFGTAVGRRTMLEVAGIEVFVSKLVDGDPLTVSGRLIVDIMKAGAPAGGKHPLSVLLDYIILTDPPQEMRSLIEQFSAKYAFLAG